MEFSRLLSYSKIKFENYECPRHALLSRSSTLCTSNFGVEEQVYDVTKFLEEHPGGDDVLLSVTGTIAMLYHYN